MKLKDLLNELDSIPLSEAEFKKIANCNSFLLFTDLAKYNSLEQLFQVNGDKILLALKSQPNFAHFIIVMFNNNNFCFIFIKIKLFYDFQFTTFGVNRD